MTVKEWATDWMECCVRPTVRPTTYAAHNYIMQNHIIPGLGGLVLEELTVADIEQFLDERKRLGSHRPESADYPGLNDETMRHIHNLLRRCLAQAVAQGYLSENPADAFSYAKPSTIKANILTTTEIEDYLDSADRLGYLPMFTLELTAGLREGELIALQWSDVDAECGTITVYEQRAVENSQVIQYGERRRTIRLPRCTLELLEQEHAKHPSSPYLFPHPGTLRPYSPNMVRLLHKRVIEEAGLDHVRFADLRHNPNDRSYIRDSSYGKAVQTMSENENKLTELLEGKEKKLLLDLVNAQGLVDGTTAVESFIQGFRLGARIAIEVMSDEDGCLRDIT